MMVLLLAQASRATDAITWPEAFMNVGCAFAIALCLAMLLRRP